MEYYLKTNIHDGSLKTDCPNLTYILKVPCNISICRNTRVGYRMATLLVKESQLFIEGACLKSYNSLNKYISFKSYNFKGTYPINNMISARFTKEFFNWRKISFLFHLFFSEPSLIPDLEVWNLHCSSCNCTCTDDAPEWSFKYPETNYEICFGKLVSVLFLSVYMHHYW